MVGKLLVFQRSLSPVDGNQMLRCDTLLKTPEIAIREVRSRVWIRDADPFGPRGQGIQVWRIVDAVATATELAARRQGIAPLNNVTPGRLALYGKTFN